MSTAFTAPLLNVVVFSPEKYFGRWVSVTLGGADNSSDKGGRGPADISNKGSSPTDVGVGLGVTGSYYALVELLSQYSKLQWTLAAAENSQRQSRSVSVFDLSSDEFTVQKSLFHSSVIKKMSVSITVSVLVISMLTSVGARG